MTLDEKTRRWMSDELQKINTRMGHLLTNFTIAWVQGDLVPVSSEDLVKVTSDVAYLAVLIAMSVYPEGWDIPSPTTVPGNALPRGNVGKRTPDGTLVEVRRPDGSVFRRNPDGTVSRQ